MKKIILIFAFTLLYTSNIFGQAQIDIPLLVTDGSLTIPMAVGLDLTATNGIDPQLGESDLPPIPPCGCFEVRFDLQPYTGHPWSTYKDYRAPGDPPAFPFTGIIEHTLWFQTSAPALPIDITYNLPYGTIMTITDQIGGSFLTLGPFVGQGTATIPGSYTAVFAKAFLKMEYNNIGGDPGGPIFGISTLNLNFPQIAVGSDTSLPVTVTNFGTTNTLTISDILSSNSYFTVSPNTFPINIDPLTTQVFQVINTSAATTQLGVIQFTHNAYGSPTALSVSAPPGFAPGPVFGISTTSLVFPQQTAGTVDSMLVTIYNYGFLNSLYINNIISSNSYFSTFPNSFPIVIEPLSSQDLYVIYTSADTTQEGTIEIMHNAPGSPTTLHVSSVNSQAKFSIYPASILFGSQPGTKSVYVSNTGNYDTLIISNIISSNSNYTVTPNTFPISILPGSIKEFYITLSNSSGFQFSTIIFMDNASGSPHRLYASNQILSPSSEGTLVVTSGPLNKTLKFGIDSVATDGIDLILDENDIPPIPPPGVFDARFVLPENNFSGLYNSWKDYRFGLNPFSWHKEYRLSYQKNYSFGIEISWYLPSNITGVLQDLSNGTFINVHIADTGSFVVQDPEIFNRLRMLIDYNIEIPVELVSFTSTLIDDNVQLDWITATEINNSGFEIQRTSPLPSPYQGEGGEAGRGWENIGFVPGFGTTTEPKSYSFIDEYVTTGTYKYRLKQIDFDGSFEFSNEIEVIVDFSPKEFGLYQNYPNPFNPTTTIKYEIPGNVILSPAVGGINSAKNLVSLKIYDVLGNEITTLINEEKQAGTYEIEFNAAQLPSGVYFYQLKAGGFVDIKKMILIK